MQAIGSYVLVKKKNVKVIYLSSKLFINEFIDAIQHNNLVKFRKRYPPGPISCALTTLQFLAARNVAGGIFSQFQYTFDGHNRSCFRVSRPASEIASRASARLAF